MNKLLTSFDICENHEIHRIYPPVTGSTRPDQCVGDQEILTD